MSIKIGGIDVAQSALDSEFRIIVLERILEAVLNKIGGTSVLTTQDIDKIRDEAFQQLQKKYPLAGLQRKK
jgi:hypothetical protein